MTISHRGETGANPLLLWHSSSRSLMTILLGTRNPWLPVPVVGYLTWMDSMYLVTFVSRTFP
jgi:hypothetical protein